MSIRIKVVTAFLAYMLLNSIFFAAVFTMKHLFLGLACMTAAQFICAYILWAVYSTER